MSTSLDAYRDGLFAVTGGQGIGLALARQADTHGMRVAILDVRVDAARRAAIGMRDATFRQCDVADADSLADTARTLEPPAILWINAGVGTLGGFVQAQAHDVAWVYEVNVMGAIHTARAFLPGMIAAGGHRHVGITASSASIASANSVYAASKHAVLAIGETLRTELEPHGIGVTLLIPGHATTRIWDGGRARQDRFGGPFELPESVGQNWAHGVTPEALAAAAFETVGGDGGYCGLVPSDDDVAAFEARAEALRRSLRVAEGSEVVT